MLASLVPMAPDTERTFAAPLASGLRGEPFRVFFPLGILLGWVGIGHWLLYALGLTSTYSCQLHATVQMQAFMMAFAVGFLLTAVPRRTRGAPPSSLEMSTIGGLLGLVAVAAVLERWAIAQASYAAVFLVLLRFAARRFVGRQGGRKPPAAFVLIPLGILQGFFGAALGLAAALGWLTGHEGLGRLLTEQGVFTCFVIGVGSLVLPLMAGRPPPADLDASPRERVKTLVYGTVGVLVGVSLVLEHAGWLRVGPGVRAALLAGGLALGGGALRAPAKPGLHRRVVWLAAWLMPAGLLATVVWPAYRVPALHVLFIGGFGLMALGVATHVTLSHTSREAAALGRPLPLLLTTILLLLAMLARVAADWSDTYFAHLGWAAALWLAGSGVWLAYHGPALIGRRWSRAE